jgi:endonuclease YncB( thermonuclease family)
MADLSRPNFARGRKHRWHHRAAARLDPQLWRLIFIVGGLLLGALALWVKDTGALRLPSLGLIHSHIVVIDGDTVRSGGHVYRLVGYNTPESGANAGCWRERILAADATWRLRQLVTSRETKLERVGCACRLGTEGTDACNYGRLTVDGKDVGRILIAEGLAERYACWATSCPKRKNWCAS